MPHAAPVPALTAPPECGQASDTRFLVDADQVRHGERAKHILAWDVERVGVDYDGDRGCDALVAAARYDDNRHGASAHARVAASCCCGLCLREQVVGVGVGRVKLADAPAPVVFEPFARDGVVVFRLTTEDLFHVGQINSVGEFDDIGNVEELGQRVFPITRVIGARVLKNLAVAFDENHVRVVFRHDDARRPAVVAKHAHVDVERLARVGKFDSDFVFFQITGHVGAPVVVEPREHVEPLVGVLSAIPAATAVFTPCWPPVFGTVTLWTFLIMFPLTEMDMRSGSLPSTCAAFADAKAMAIGSVQPVATMSSSSRICTYAL